jgi:hypothetical protein
MIFCGLNMIKWRGFKSFPHGNTACMKKYTIKNSNSFVYKEYNLQFCQVTKSTMLWNSNYPYSITIIERSSASPLAVNKLYTVNLKFKCTSSSSTPCTVLGNILNFQCLYDLCFYIVSHIHSIQARIRFHTGCFVTFKFELLNLFRLSGMLKVRTRTTKCP